MARDDRGTACEGFRTGDVVGIAVRCASRHTGPLAMPYNSHQGSALIAFFKNGRKLGQFVVSNLRATALFLHLEELPVVVL